jgi:hypothetical protein
MAVFIKHHYAAKIVRGLGYMGIHRQSGGSFSRGAFGTLAGAVVSHRKPALLLASMFGAAFLMASGSHAQSNGAAPVQPTDATTTVPKSAPDAARKGGPKGGGRDKEDVGRTDAPAPNAAVEERRRKGPKGDGAHGRTQTPAPDAQPAARKEGPKDDGSHGRTATTPNRGSNLLLIGVGGAAAVLAILLATSGDEAEPTSP